MENIKHFGIGVGLFALITLTILGIEYITVDILSMTPKAVGNTLMVLALLIIAKPFGELSVSVYNNTVKNSKESLSCSMLYNSYSSSILLADLIRFNDLYTTLYNNCFAVSTLHTSCASFLPKYST